MNTLVHALEKYTCYNRQETRDKALILHALKTQDEVYLRANTLCHMTASAWVVNQDSDKILMVHHNLYKSWSWLGGHADGQEDLLAVAIKEVKEESGLTHLRALDTDIFSVEVLTVDGHMKNGAYVSSHLHLNITYILQANDQDPLTIKADENSGVAWFSLDKALAASSEPWFRDHIYSKLNDKLQARLES